MMRFTCDLLEKDEVEHVTGDGDVELVDDHGGDVGSEEDSGPKKDADNVSAFLLPGTFGRDLFSTMRLVMLNIM